MSVPPWPTLRTARLTVRPFEHGDRDALVALMGDPVVTARTDGPVPPDRAAEIHARFVAQSAPRDFIGFAAERSDTGAFVGMASLQRRESGLLELGFLLASAHWGQGFGTELASAVARWALDERGEPGLLASVDLGHTPSERILARLGFVEIRRHDDEDPAWLELELRPSRP